MLSNPVVGQPAQVWYNKRLAPEMPLHGKVGSIRIVCKARRCRNHGVEIDGKIYAVPCGNLRPPGGHRRTVEGEP